jgi:type I restriction enzyme S subunit
VDVKRGYKQTEAGLIPDDWGTRRVADIALTVASGTSGVDSEFGDYPVYGSTGIIGRCLNGHYSGAAILVARVGANAGKLAIVDGRYGVTDNTIIIRIDDSCHLEYFWRQLAAKRLNSMVFGSGQPLITGSQIKNLSIPLPSTKEEQEAIAGALSDADALIESLEQLLAKKCHLKQGTMQELLTGRKRLPGFIGEWEARRLGDTASLYQPVTISAHQLTKDGYPVYGANGVIGFFDAFNHDTWQVTVTCRGSTCGTVNRTVDKCWITGNAMVVHCDGSARAVKEFLYYLLSSADLSSCITGTGQPQIVRTPLANFELRLPADPKEQTAIATVLSDIDADIDALKAKLAKARQIKQGMMQELLTGKIRLV